MAKRLTAVGWGSGRNEAGFGLVEVIAVVLITAVVAAVAVPSFRSIRISSDVRSVSSDLATAITLARTQAVTLRVDVKLSPLDNDWSKGWQVIYDWPAGAPAVESDVTVAKSGSVTITGPDSDVLFRSSGIINNGAISFELCRAEQGREIQVTPLGRVNVEGGAC
ncbi:GspH/FimT family protein [Alcanivorax quisquiliarum]|uniref:Type II secretion system protein H n=1 Tax=Alcanivorax quisquiliarum TaxID=2933565 RepID=A0ABT0EA21_9GAMM|nr:GspH/FimT family protein [Alcanivorax quisquiliarum]MCK0538499.1 GspH/FimT family protein [Alcanivorax quisquiliarum]